MTCNSVFATFAGENLLSSTSATHIHSHPAYLMFVEIVDTV